MLSPWEHWTGQRSSTSHGGAACVNMCCGWMRTSHARLQLSHIGDNCFMYSCPTTRSTPFWYIKVPSLNSSILIVFQVIWHMWLIGDTWDVWLFGFEVLRHDNKISRFSLITNYSKKLQWQQFPCLSVACVQDKCRSRHGGSIWSLLMWIELSLLLHLLHQSWFTAETSVHWDICPPSIIDDWVFLCHICRILGHLQFSLITQYKLFNLKKMHSNKLSNVLFQVVLSCVLVSVRHVSVTEKSNPKLKKRQGVLVLSGMCTSITYAFTASILKRSVVFKH